MCAPLLYDSMVCFEMRSFITICRLLESGGIANVVLSQIQWRRNKSTNMPVQIKTLCIFRDFYRRLVGKIQCFDCTPLAIVFHAA